MLGESGAWNDAGRVRLGSQDSVIRIRSRHLKSAYGAFLGCLLSFAVSQSASADSVSGGSPSLSRAAVECKDASATYGAREKSCWILLEASTLTPKERALAHYFRAISIAHDDRLEEAVQELFASISSDPDLWVAYGFRSTLRQRLRQYDGAAADITHLLRLFPKSASLYAHRGATLVQAGYGSEAVVDLNRAIDLHDVGDAKGDAYRLNFYEWRAYAFEQIHQWNNALADYDTVIAHKDDTLSYDAYGGRGRIEFLTGSFDAAAQDLEKANDLAKESDQYHLIWLYFVEARQGKPAQANLRDRLPFVDTSAWPGPILHFLAGELSADQIALPTGKDPAIEGGAKCDLAFFRGELFLLQDKKPEAKQAFQRALATKRTEYFEYSAAQAELEKIAATK